jgi:hypothetical protein
LGRNLCLERHDAGSRSSADLVKSGYFSLATTACAK